MKIHYVALNEMKIERTADPFHSNRYRDTGVYEISIIRAD